MINLFFFIILLYNEEDDFNLAYLNYKKMKRIIKRIKNPNRISILDYLRLKIFTKFYIDRKKSIGNSIWLAGMSRSGTTWLAEMLAKYLHSRLIFEPFHPKRVPQNSDLAYRYLDSKNKDREMLEKMAKILKGKIRNDWIDSDNRFFFTKGRIIKSIRSNLLLAWIRKNFPKIPIIFIIRHPCAVVSSRLKMNWEPSEYDIIIKQKNLISTHLKNYKNLLENTETKLEKLTVLWCIENLVPLSTMAKEDYLIVTYENLVRNLKKEFRYIINYINPKIKFNQDKIENKKSLLSTKHSAIIQNIDPLEIWRLRLDPNQIKKIIEIVQMFSLNSLYDYEIMPKESIITKKM